MNFKIEQLSFDEHGLIPAIVQDAASREVLMLAWMNAESLRRTLETGETWFWSRSRKEFWHKGQSSGNTQRLLDVCLDCDLDALVVLVEPAGPACHTGARTCFHNQIQVASPAGEGLSDKLQFVAQDDKLKLIEHRESRRSTPSSEVGSILDELYTVIESRRRERPENSYTTQLFNEGLDKIIEKVSEESAETVLAAKHESKDRLVAEASDLIYHLLVLLAERGVTLEQVRDELSRRRGKRSS